MPKDGLIGASAGLLNTPTAVTRFTPCGSVENANLVNILTVLALIQSVC